VDHHLKQGRKFLAPVQPKEAKSYKCDLEATINGYVKCASQAGCKLSLTEVKRYNLSLVQAPCYPLQRARVDANNALAKFKGLKPPPPPTPQLDLLAAAVAATDGANKRKADDNSGAKEKKKKADDASGGGKEKKKKAVGRPKKKKDDVPVHKATNPDLVLPVTEIHDIIRRCFSEKHTRPMDDIISDVKFRQCFQILRDHHKSFEPVIIGHELSIFDKHTHTFLYPCPGIDRDKCGLFRMTSRTLEVSEDNFPVCNQCKTEQHNIAKSEARFQRDGETIEEAIERRTNPESTMVNSILTPEEMCIKMERLQRGRKMLQRSNNRLTEKVTELEMAMTLHSDMEQLLEEKLKLAKKAIAFHQKNAKKRRSS
jgi:hypothetical protein